MSEGVFQMSYYFLKYVNCARVLGNNKKNVHVSLSWIIITTRALYEESK